MPPGAPRGVRDKGFWETALPERSAFQVEVERAISLRCQETRRKQVLDGNGKVPCGCELSPLVGSPDGAGGNLYHPECPLAVQGGEGQA